MGKGKKRSRESDSEGDIIKRLRRLEKELERSKQHDRRSDRRSDENKENTKTNQQQESCPTCQEDKVAKTPEVPPLDRAVSVHSGPVSPQNQPHPRDVAQPEIPSNLEETDSPSGSKPLDEVTELSSEQILPDEGTHQLPEPKKLDEATETLLGDDPACTNPKKVDVHQSLVTRWSAWLSEGLTKEVKDKVLEKYPRTGNLSLEAPALNAEIAPTLNDAALKRDNLFIVEQNYAGSALSALGEAVTMILNDDEEPVDRLDLLEILADVGKLLSQLHYQISSTRKAFIAPSLSKQVRDLLQKMKPSASLYGEKLSGVIKTAKSVEKMGKEIKGTSTPASTSGNYKKTALKTPSGRSLNWRGPYARQGTSHQGQRYYQPKTSYPKSSQYNNRPAQNNLFKRTKTNQYPQSDQNNKRQ